MFQKFNSNNTITDFIKNIVNTIYIPNVQI